MRTLFDGDVHVGNGSRYCAGGMDTARSAGARADDDHVASLPAAEEVARRAAELRRAGRGERGAGPGAMIGS